MTGGPRTRRLGDIRLPYRHFERSEKSSSFAIRWAMFGKFKTGNLLSRDFLALRISHSSSQFKQSFHSPSRGDTPHESIFFLPGDILGGTMFSYKFLGNKLLHLFLVFLGVSIVTFAISHVIPGDPARMLVGPHASAETLAAARERMSAMRSNSAMAPSCPHSPDGGGGRRLPPSAAGRMRGNNGPDRRPGATTAAAAGSFSRGCCARPAPRPRASRRWPGPARR